MDVREQQVWLTPGTNRTDYTSLSAFFRAAKRFRDISIRHLWFMELCSLIELLQGFRETECLNLQWRKFWIQNIKEGISSTDTFVANCRITQEECYNPDDNKNINYHKKLKFTMRTKPTSAYGVMWICYNINVINLLHVSANFCGHLQGGTVRRLY